MKPISVFLIALMGFGTVALYAQEEERRMVSGFDAVSVWGNIELHLIPGEGESLELSSRDESLSNIITEVKGGKLVIKMRAGIYEYGKVSAYLTFENLVEVKGHAGARVQSEYRIKGDRIEISSGSGARVELEVEAQSTFLKSAEGAELEVWGKSKYVEANARTGGMLYAAGLESESAYVRISMGGEAEIKATRSVEGKVTSGGNLKIYGDPDRDHVSTSLGGWVRRKSL